MKRLLVSNFLFLSAFCLNVCAEDVDVAVNGRYRIVERENLIMKLDAETGRTWVFEPARGWGQVDLWQEVTNY